MRKFIIGDIHGFGNFYYSVMNYLDNISKTDPIEVYINGDLIDRGLESAEILLDLKRRITDNKYKIVYLGGNHELMMYEVSNNRKNGHFSYFNDWYHNGGYITDNGLTEIFKDDNDSIDEIVDFIGNLKIYHKFEEKINNRPIVLVHAACPKIVKDNCNLLIKENSQTVYNAVWTRKFNPYLGTFGELGNRNYFTIVGHTPNNDRCGIEYDYRENVLNIDGGCACYVSGMFNYNHFPLVEVMDNALKILTFNDKNEITHGNYYEKGRFSPLSRKELNNERLYLNKDVKIKKLSINEDGIVGYWK